MSWINVFSLLGGLGLFLYGMKLMGEGLEHSATSRLRSLLERLTANKLLGTLVGFLITAVIQSSSATTVMVVGFVNAGLINLSQAASVIMGANIGTTLTGLIIALKLSNIAPLFVFLGVLLIVFSKKGKIQNLGTILAGFGILFLGMSSMSSAMKPLGEAPWLSRFFSYTQNPFIGILAGAIITALLQSSSASLGILIAMASLGIVSLDQAIYILYGQNIGTCVTAIIASIGASKTAKGAAAIHLMFNVFGTAIFTVLTLSLPFVPFIESLGLPPGQQFAFAHIIFNVVSTILLLPASPLLVSLSEKIIKGEDKKEQMSLEFLDERILSTPSVAVSQVLKEINRMGDIAKRNIRLSAGSIFSYDQKQIAEVFSNEKIINFLNHQITSYLVRLSALDVSPEDNKTIGSLFHVVNDIERIGDHAENIAEIAKSLKSSSSSFSPQALEELSDMTNQVERLLSITFTILSLPAPSMEDVRSAVRAEEEIDQKTVDMKNNHIKRLTASQCLPEAGALFVDLIINLERVADHAENIALANLPTPKGN